MREEPTRLKIGQFARIGHVSIATLRYYDQHGLLKPNALDPVSGYRYYSLDQLPRLHRILALKDLGFPLEQIASVLEHEPSLDQLCAMFELKQAQTQHMITLEQARLKRIAARLRQIEQEGKMPTYEILVKCVEPLLVASIRGTIPLGEDLAQGYEKIAAYLEQQHIVSSQPSLLLLHSRYELHNEILAIDVETAVPISTVLPTSGLISIRTLPARLMACTVHTGDSLSLGRAHLALHGWLKENAYQLIDTPRHVYLQRWDPLNPGKHITELQFPIADQ